MRNKALSVNIDNSNLPVYPNGRIKDNTGPNDGTPVNEFIYGDIHENKDKLLRLAGITHNNLPDNELNGYQLIEALRDLGSKHDAVQTLSSVTGVLNVTAKLGTMLDNESLICKSSANFTIETEIKGSDLTLFPITVIGNFKSNEYVRLIKFGGSILLIRLIDSVNLNLAVSELFYLKKASQTEENNGAIDTVATTPLVNKTAFIRRVNGADSNTYLATSLQNGIYPKEHFEFVDSFINPIRNKGWVGSINVGFSSGALPINGDFTLAVASSVSGTYPETFITVTMANAMDNIDYLVKMYVESESSLGNDNDLLCPVFKKISTTQFQIGIAEVNSIINSVKIHIEVVQL